MKRFILALVATLLLTAESFADEYEKTCTEILNKVKIGIADVDYSALRLNCARTDWYVNRPQTKIDKKFKEMYAFANKSNYKQVKDVAESVIEINYLNMNAHKALSWALEALGDSAGAKFHRNVEIGLLRSLGQSGSGKSCKEAKVVIDVEEEYFVMQVMGWKLKRQSTVTDGDNQCDMMEVIDADGKERTEFFNVNIVFENYRRNYK